MKKYRILPLLLIVCLLLTAHAPVADAPLDIGPTRRDGWDPGTWIDERCSQESARRSP